MSVVASTSLSVLPQTKSDRPGDNAALRRTVVLVQIISVLINCKPVGHAAVREYEHHAPDRARAVVSPQKQRLSGVYRRRMLSGCHCE